jgi:uncharacterized membrane protein
MNVGWIWDYGWDLAALLFHAVAFSAYRVVQRVRGRRDPSATMQSQQAGLRAQWVAEVLAANNGILGVQTLRNALSAVLFFASNTMFLVIGTITLTANRELRETWGLLDPGQQSAHLSQLKLLILLLTLLFAFLCFINGIRLFSHASLSIATKSASAALVTAQINDAWRYQGLGVRCYYFAAPVLFWLFGAPWLVLASLGMLAVMHSFDSAHNQR